MDLTISPELEAMRERVRELVQARAPKLKQRAGVRAPETAEEAAVLRQWTADLFEAGVLGADWPEEWGGRPGRDPMEGFVVSAEMAAASAPIPLGAGPLAAHAVIMFGTDEQKRRFLPAIRSAEHIWCQLFSEPDAGSDLASMKTRAVLDGDTWVIDGQKVWSTNAHWADYGYLLARTDPDVEKHQGITVFALDMRTPGVDVRPLREITGTTDFNEVFFDGVRIPADCAIGQAGQGWMIATASLVQERHGVAAAGIRLRRGVRDLVELARDSRRDGVPAIDHRAVRQELGRLHAEVEICNLLGYASLTHELRGQMSLSDAPIGKLFFSELNLDMATVALELEGPASVLVEGDARAVDDGRWQDEFLYARAFTIAGGSSEIMRNMLSERALGMPREPKPSASAGVR